MIAAAARRFVTLLAVIVGVTAVGSSAARFSGFLRRNRGPFRVDEEGIGGRGCYDAGCREPL